jgi:hypothetical protein
VVDLQIKALQAQLQRTATAVEHLMLCKDLVHGVVAVVELVLQGRQYLGAQIQILVVQVDLAQMYFHLGYQQLPHL